MKFMKLGTRPDTFFTAEAIRSVSSEVSTDLKIQVQNAIFLLHKFPLLSKSARLQRLCSEHRHSTKHTIIHLPDLPGGTDAFELCAKFCYGITITLSATNIVPVRCAADYLEMNEDIDKGNLNCKLDAFFNSCILHRWRDTLVTLQSTKQHPGLSERLRITSRCIDIIAAMIVANPSKAEWYQVSQKAVSRGWWAEDISELEIDHYWRVMVAVNSAARVSDRILGEALQIYACRWLPNVSKNAHESKEMQEKSCSGSPQEITLQHRLLLERIVNLLPMEKGSLSCSFLLRLLKEASILNASSSSKMELARRVAVQLEDATVADLLIPSLSRTHDTLYDVDIVMTIVEEFMLQGQSPQISPPRDKLGFERRRSRSAEKVDLEALENSRRSSSASHSSKLRVAKLIDGYLQEIARDVNLPLEKVIALAKAVPDFARPDHDDLYRVIDIYLKSHPDLDKNSRKQICRILDCKKLSVEACMRAAQNELLPLRVVVQVLFFEQARAAMTCSQLHELPTNIRALLAKTSALDEDEESSKFEHLKNGQLDDDWSLSGVRCPTTKLTTLRMKLAEDDNDYDDASTHCDGLGRSASSRLKNLCSIPSKPKKMFSKLRYLNKSVRERQ